MADGYRSDYKQRRKTWEDKGSARYRHRVKTSIENRRQQQNQQPQAQTPPGWDLPRVSQTGAPGVEGQQQGAQQGPTYQEALPYAFTYKGSIHQPTNYWEDPQKIIDWHDRMSAAPDIQLPDGMDQQTLTGLYDYLQYRNKGNANRNLWRAFGADDPMREYVSALPTPAKDYLTPDEQKRWTVPEVGGNSQTDYRAADFDWQRLTVEQKQAVLNDPNFRISQVTAMGQQGLILSDPEFNLIGKSKSGELPWWQPVAFYALSNPQTAPIGQALLMGGMTTAATGNLGVGALTAGGALALGYAPYIPDEGVMGALRWTLEGTGRILMSGAQTVEQIAGLGQYLSAGSKRVGHAAYTPEELAVVQERTRTFMQNPKEVFGAMKVFYETAGGDNVWVLGEGEKVPVRPGYTLDDAVKRVLNGESADVVLADYTREYGINGVASDLLMQSILDPLNAAPDVAGVINTEVAKTKIGHATAELGQLQNLGVLDQAQTQRAAQLDARIAIEGAKATVFESTPAMTGLDARIPFTDIGITFGETGRKFRALIQSGAITADQAQYLTKWERRLAGITPDGKIKELGPTPKAPKFIEKMVSLQPKVKAKIFLEKFSTNIATLFDWGKMSDATPRDLVTVMKAASNGDMQVLHNAGAEFLSSPEAYTTIGAARDIMPQIEGKLATYEAAEPNRRLFWDVQKIVGDDPRQLLNDLTGDNKAAAWQRLQEKLQGSNMPEAAALLNEIQAGNINPDKLAAMFKPFRDGNIALHPQEFSATILNTLQDHMSSWGKDYFGLKNDTIWDDSLRLLKGAQSLLLLDMSPTAIVNDFVNERVMMATTGTLGLTPDRVISKWVEEFGIMPKDVDTWQQVETVHADPVSQLTRGNSSIGKVADTLNKARSTFGLRPRASEAFNTAHAKQMYYKHAKTFWSKQWRVGKGFDRMSPALEGRLREYGIEPGRVYQNLQGVLSTKQLDLISERITNNSVSVFTDEAARQLGKDPAEVTRMLEELGVADELRARLENADTPAKRQAAFDAVETKVLENFDIKQAEGLKNFLEQKRNQIATEGPAGVVRAFHDIALDYFERKLDNDRIWDDAFERANQTDDYGLRQSIKRQAARKNADAWRRTQARQGALYTAAIEGLGLDTEFKRTYLASLSDQHRVLRDFFTERSRRVEEFFDIDYPSVEARTGAWRQLEAELNERFAQDQRRVLKVQEDMNAAFVAEMERTFGEPGGAMAKAWTDNVLRHSASMHETITSFRKGLEGFTNADKELAWQEFKPEYRKQWMERMQADMDGANRLYKWDDDGQAPQGQPPQQPPEPGAPAAPAAPEPQSVLEAAQALRAQKEAERQNLTAIWDAAERYSRMEPGNSSNYNRGYFQDQYALLGALKKAEYGGDPTIKNMQDAARKLTPDQVRDILERRTQAKQQTIDAENAARTQRLEQVRAEAQAKQSARKTPENITLLGAIKKHGGIDWSGLSEFGEANAKGFPPGTFSKRGKNRWMLDEMAQILADDGYPIDMNNPDVTPTNQLIELMRRQQQGEKVYPVGHDYEMEMVARQAEAVEAARILEEDTTTINDMETWEADVKAAAESGDFITLAELADSLPEDVAQRQTLGGETYAEYLGRVWNETEQRIQSETLAEAMTRAQMDVQAQETAGKVAMTRQLFRDQLRDAFGLVDDQADAVVSVTDARAEAWAKMTGRDAAEWYAERLDSVVRGGEGDLFQAARNISHNNVIGSVDEIGGYMGGHWVVNDRSGTVIDAKKSAGMWHDLIIEDLVASGQISKIPEGKLPDSHAIDQGFVKVNFGPNDLLITTSDVNQKTLRRLQDLYYERKLFPGKHGTSNVDVIWEGKNGTISTTLDDFLASNKVSSRGREITLEQAAPAGAKGAITFLDDGRAVIRAFEKADVSTVVHEVGHVFRRELSGNDLATVESWAGVKDGTWKVEHEEKFARGFERYLAEGKAPTPKLKKVFDNFKTWLAEIYQSITGSAIDVKISDQVREVFDRLLGEERPKAEPDLRQSAEYKANLKRAQEKQTGMFGAGEDTPLFSGTPMRAQEEVFAPKPPGPEQGTLFQGDYLDRLPANDETPIYPPGGYEQATGYVDYSKILLDGYAEEVKPVMDAMKQAAGRSTEDIALSSFDAGTQAELKQWLKDVRGRMASTKKQASSYAEAMRDFALLDYGRQYGFDKPLSAGVPYEFYTTRSAASWLTRVADKPAWISQFLRLQQVHNTYQNQLPERMRNKFYVPMPFLPEWAGGGMFIDPTYQLFPFRGFTSPLDSMRRDDQALINNTYYILRNMAEDGSLTDKQAMEAWQTKQGAVWERAIAQAKVEQGETKNGPADYFSMLLSPALYLTLPYYFATGKKSGDFGWPAGQLPITRFGQALETAFNGTPLEWVGDIAGNLAKPEKMIREARGLGEFGEWGDYYIDRQLANMAAEGADVKAVQQAMIERKGPLFDQAEQRVREELMLKVPGMAPLYGLTHGATLDKVVGSALPSLFPGGLLPPGEMEYKGLKQEYSLAWEAKAQGNDTAITNFFDEHPEYSARLALRRDPQERLTQFVRSEIWDALGKLEPTDKKQATAFLGPQFDQFYDSSNEIPLENLVRWARMLKGMVPETQETAPLLEQQVPNIDYLAPQVTSVTDRYFTERKEKFPHYYSLQSTYYSLPRSEQAKFLLKFPEYAEYKAWRDRYYKDYPELKPVFNGELFRRVDTSYWPPALKSVVEQSAYTGRDLPSGAASVLYQVWEMEGQPWGDFESWVEMQVYPGVLNQQVQDLVQ